MDDNTTVWSSEPRRPTPRDHAFACQAQRIKRALTQRATARRQGLKGPMTRAELAKKAES